MNVLFFALVSTMVLVALAWVLPFLLRNRADVMVDRDRQNIVFAKERLAELEAQLQDGLIGEEDFRAACEELELTLLEDVAQNSAPEAVPHTRVSKWPGLTVAAGVPIIAGLLYLTLGTPGAFLVDESASTVALPKEHPQNSDQPMSLQELVARVEQRLQQDPQDPRGWEILANTYAALDRYGDAATALQRLMQLVGERADLLVRRADALATSRGGALAGEPQQLLSRALELEPDHPIGLWLSGVAAGQGGDHKTSLEFLRRAEPLFANKPESQAVLREQIANAERQLSTAQTTTRAAPTAEPVRQGPVSITVKVDLDESLKQLVSAEDTVFILARAAQGPRMPLAVSRKQVKDLPVEVELNDSMAMMPNMKLSDFKTVDLIARVSKSGNAIAQSGDLMGKNGPLELPITGPITVSISQRVP